MTKITARVTGTPREVCRHCGAFTDIARGAEGTEPPWHMTAREWHAHASCVEGQDWSGCTPAEIASMRRELRS